MNPGTKPKPKALRLLQGEKKKSRINQNEPEPEIKTPTCPEWIGGTARKEWDRIINELEPLGYLTEMDRAALTAYCDSYGRWADASVILRKEGLIIRTETERIVQNPALAIIAQALKEMKGFLVEFGMTPSSRTRIVSPKKKPKNSFADIE